MISSLIVVNEKDLSILYENCVISLEQFCPKNFLVIRALHRPIVS